MDDAVKSAALELFLDQGYEATTMEEVAAAAGITKRTLYKRYADKAELFSAAMRQAREEFNAPDIVHGKSGDISFAGELEILAQALLDQALDARTIKLSRIAAAQSGQFPEEITNAYDISLSPRIEAVTRVLEHHRNEIDPDMYAELANLAELFISIVTGIPARLAGYGKLRGKAFETQRLKVAVKLFLRGIEK